MFGYNGLRGHLQGTVVLAGVAAILGISVLIYKEVQKRREIEDDSSGGENNCSGACSGPPPPQSYVPQTLPLTILYASTTGAARRLALRLSRSLFALRSTGFAYDVSLEDLAGYNVERLEEEAGTPRVLVIFMPTWTNGAPPATGAPLHAHLRDLAADFRTPRNALRNLTTVIFGLGHSEYGENWCKAAKECEEALECLGATPLLPMEKGDDGKDMEGSYSAWADAILLPALCEHYAQLCGVVGDAAGQEAGSMVSSTSVGEKKRSNKDGFLPRKVWRREKKAAKEAHELARELELRRAAAATSAASTTCCGSGGGTVGGGNNDGVNEGCCKKSSHGAPPVDTAGSPLDSEWFYEGEEEDSINARLIAEEPPPLSTTTVPKKKNTLAAGVGRRGKKRGVVEPPPKKNSETGIEGGHEASQGQGPGEEDEDSVGEEEEGLLDMEDVSTVMLKATTSNSADSNPSAPPREMVTPAQRRALTKEGYKIIGTHSAVKMCRWTKAQLRGRGGCYKHTFYGINSYQCMEATPSLACANKCTFCWRHHKNPVGREWRWKVDPPEDIVEGAIARHVTMVREFGGTPGVNRERWLAALTPKHCALSLVGEPIMYPHINALLRLLHARGISSFLVTNAQFPDAIAALEPVTQLYVSIDAGNEADLREVDRPLFSDFWARFLGCLDALRAKRQRTVYRLTLIKGEKGNMGPNAVREYASLIARGAPELIEVKGVTWSGVSDGGGLTMASVPWHSEVREFCVALQQELERRRTLSGGGDETLPNSTAPPPAYGLAGEHAHSCCVLMAQLKYYHGEEGGWHTHIDYPKFQELVAKWYAGGADFGSEDFCAPTPAWAVWGAPEAGFSPAEERGRRGGRALAAGL